MDINALRKDHSPEAVRRRLQSSRGGDYLGDAVLGSVDGLVTTFAVVTGAEGAGFGGAVVVVLGLSNLVADGFSMGASNYLGTRSRSERMESARKEEEQHIRLHPEGEREEISQIFSLKGFEGETLERIVETISQDQRLWVETMLREEHGLPPTPVKPFKAGLITFGAFAFTGILPLLPYLLPLFPLEYRFLSSCLATGIAFLGIGLAKGIILEAPPIRSSLETLAIGGAAALLAYSIGYWLRVVWGM